MVVIQPARQSLGLSPENVLITQPTQRSHGPSMAAVHQSGASAQTAASVITSPSFSGVPSQWQHPSLQTRKTSDATSSGQFARFPSSISFVSESGQTLVTSASNDQQSPITPGGNGDIGALGQHGQPGGLSPYPVEEEEWENALPCSVASFGRRCKLFSGVPLIWMLASLAFLIALIIHSRDANVSPRDKRVWGAMRIISFPGFLWLRAIRLLALPMLIANTISVLNQMRGFAGGGTFFRLTFGYYLLTFALGCALSCVLTYYGIQDWTSEFNELPDMDDYNNSEWNIDILPHGARRSPFVNTTVTEQIEAVIWDALPSNSLLSIVSDNLTGSVLLALVIGYSISSPQSSTVLKFFEEVSGICAKVMEGLVTTTPIGVFFLALPKLAQADIPKVLEGIGLYLGVVFLAIAVHTFLILPAIYMLLSGCRPRHSPFAVLMKSIPALRAALIMGSSTLAYPLTVRCSIRTLRNHPGVAKFVLPIGTRFNFDAQALLFPIALGFLATSQNQPLAFPELVMIAVFTGIISLGSSTIPFLDVIRLVLLEKAAGIQLDGIFALLLVVCCLHHPLSIASSVYSDILLSEAVDALVPKLQKVQHVERRGTDAAAEQSTSSPADEEAGAATAAGAGRGAHGKSRDHIKMRNALSVSQPLLIRRVTVNDFQIVRLLGQGAFGQVLLVRKRDTKQLYAMKILNKQQLRELNQIAHAQTERRLLEVLDHPFIVKLRFAFQTRKSLYLVMDYCPGGELYFHLTRSGPFQEHKARFYAAQIVLALEYLHSKDIVYRDLKPENLLLDARGNVVLTDFGLSKENVKDHASARSFVGSPEYLAPEVLTRSGHGKAADFYSLGVVLYELLTGQPPFYHTNPERLYHKTMHDVLRIPNYLTPAAQSLLRGLLDRNVATRLKTANELKHHAFFAFVDWNAILQGRETPPIQPTLRNDDDTSNFDSQFTVNVPLFDPDDIAEAKRASPFFKSSALKAIERKEREERRVRRQMREARRRGELTDGMDEDLGEFSEDSASAAESDIGDIDVDEDEDDVDINDPSASKKFKELWYPEFDFVASELLRPISQRGHKSGTTIQVAAASTPHTDTSRAQEPKKRGFFARLFGWGGNDSDAEETRASESSSRTSIKSPKGAGYQLLDDTSSQSRSRGGSALARPSTALKRQAVPGTYVAPRATAPKQSVQQSRHQQPALPRVKSDNDFKTKAQVSHGKGASPASTATSTGATPAGTSSKPATTPDSDAAAAEARQAAQEEAARQQLLFAAYGIPPPSPLGQNNGPVVTSTTAPAPLPAPAPATGSRQVQANRSVPHK